MCTHAHAHISKHQKEQSMQTLLFLALKGKKILKNHMESKTTHIK